MLAGVPTRLPLTVIGGFLGAGKTSALRHWLQRSGGQRLAVLVNDFGALNIDAELVASSGADAIALNNGCVCCSIGDDLSAALIRVIDAKPAFDAVVIEASGVADPWRIAQVALADPALGLSGVIVLVDAQAVLEQAADPLLQDSLVRQLRGADLVVVNKTDLVDAEALAAVHAWLDGAVKETPRVETRDGVIDEALRGGDIAAGHHHSHLQAGKGGHDDHHQAHHGHHHGTQFESWSSCPDGLFSAGALRAVLATMPAGVLRLKGFVRTDQVTWAEVQFAGRHGSLRPALDVPSGGAALVAIGLKGKLPVQALGSLLASARIPD
jgi:G3E family GTPase